MYKWFFVVQSVQFWLYTLGVVRVFSGSPQKEEVSRPFRDSLGDAKRQRQKEASKAKLQRPFTLVLH